MRRRWHGRAAVLTVAVWLLRATPPVLAQEEAPDGGDGGGGWLDRINPAEWFDRTRDAFFDALVRLFTDPERGLPALLGEALRAWLSAAWDAVWGAFEPFNFFTQIPTWIVGLPFIERAWDTLFPLAAVGLGLAAVATLGLSMVSVMGGKPPDVLFSGLRHVMRGAVGLIVGTRLYLTFIEVSNGLSARLLDPTGGLPGLERMNTLGQAVSFPVLLLLYALFACLFFFIRAKVVFTCVACLILAPVAFVLGALPFKKAQDAFDVWLTFAVASAFVQVVQAVFLGIGANVLIHGTAGAGQGPQEEVAAGIVGIMSIFAAGTVPTMILGAMLNRSLVPAGTLHHAAHVAQALATLAIWRAPVPPPDLTRVYPPPPPPPTVDRAVTAGAGPRRIIEYVPPMLPPPTPP
jgi:hypothetical protein